MIAEECFFARAITAHGGRFEVSAVDRQAAAPGDADPTGHQQGIAHRATESARQ